MPRLYEPWKRHRQSARRPSDPRHEVDDLLGARHPMMGVGPAGWGHRLRRHARETLHDGPGERHGIFGLPMGISLVLLVFGMLLVVTYIVGIFYYGPLGGLRMVGTILLAAGAGLLLMAGVLLVFTVIILLVTAPWRLVSLLRRGTRYVMRRGDA